MNLQSRNACVRLISPDAEIAAQEPLLPKFTVTPLIGRQPVDELRTDLLLVSKLYGMDIHPSLQVQEPTLAASIRETVESYFPGRSGTCMLLPLSLPSSRGPLNRHHLFVGLGTPADYLPQTACDIFQLFIEQALILRAEHITVPFVPNPMTKNSFTHKATAYKFKETLIRILGQWHGPVYLQEVQLFCTPSAAGHINAALLIDNGISCGC